MEKRNQELDIIRAAAILLVIIQHAWSMLGLNDPSHGFVCAGYQALIYGVPLFVMLSGFLQLDHPMPLGVFLKKRFSRILLPFLLWAVIVYAVSVVMHRYEEVTTWREALLQFFPYLLTNRINAAYWYVFMLIGLYLITPLLQAAFHAAPDRKRLLEYCLLVWVCVTALGDLFPACAIVTYFPIVGYVGYYLLGYYLCLQANDRRMNLLIGAVGFPVAYVLNVLMIRFGRPVATLEILEIVCLFLLLKSVRLNSASASGLVCRISRYSYTIYLTHFVLIAFCYSFFPQLFPVSWATPLYTALLVLAVEFLFCYILDRLSFIPNRLIGIS